jgi:DNA-nicking Smr family endonuclease
MRDVQPLLPRSGHSQSSPPLALTVEQLAARRRHASGEDSGAELADLHRLSDHFQATPLYNGDRGFVQAGYGPDLLRKLRLGAWPIEASLDLHGATLDQARSRLDEFLATCLAHRIKCVCIVHGKGYGSRDGKPVLKDTVRRWLSQLACVRAYMECPEHLGGAGAVQVLLRVMPNATHDN